MLWIQRFVEENIWLCVIGAVVAWIVIDEVFSITRRIFGERDYAEPPEEPPAALRRAAKEAQEEFPDAADSVPVEDFLGPERRD